MKKIFIIVFCLVIGACVKNDEILKYQNEYYQSNYEINDTKLSINKLNFEQILNYEEVINDEKYIILILEKSCPYSKELFNQFIDEYNNHSYSFDEIYVFEVNDYVVEKNEEQTDKNRERYLKKFDISNIPVTIFVSKKEAYNIEIGYYSENILKDILAEFERK